MEKQKKTYEELENQLIIAKKHCGDLQELFVRSERLYKEQAEKLQRSQKLLSETGKLAKVGGWEFSPSDDKLIWTDEVYYIHELPIDFVPNMESALDFYTPQSKEIISKAFVELMEKGISYDLELQLITSKGNLRWVRALGSAVFKNDQLYKLMGSFQDITSTAVRFKNLDRIIEVSSCLFTHSSSDQSMLMLVADAMKEISHAKYVAFTRYNETNYNYSIASFSATDEKVERAIKIMGVDFTRMKWDIGFRKEELINNNSLIKFETLNDLAGLSFPKKAITFLGKYLDLGPVYIIKIIKDDQFLGDFTLFFPKDKDLIYRRTVQIFASQVGFYISQKKFEAALKSSNIKHLKMIANISDVIMILNQQGIVTYLSPSFEDFFGFASKDFLGQHGWSNVHPEDLNQIINEFTNILKAPKATAFAEFRHRCNDGSYRSVEINAINMIDDSDIGGILCKYHDITRHKTNEQIIQMQNLDLEKSNKEKDRFFSIVAHDLRGPFNAFLGLTEFLADELPSMSSIDAQKIAFDLKKTANNFFDLLDNLLKWSQIKLGTMPFNLTSFCFLEVINESINPLIDSIIEKNINIVNSIPGDLFIEADQNMIQLVIFNLTSNSLKFTPHGGMIRYQARLEQNNQVLVSVTDSGIGMNQHILDNLFRIDVKISCPGTENEQSTGLGLLLCKEIVEKHGGTIWAESQEGIGSTFNFILKRSVKL